MRHLIVLLVALPLCLAADDNKVITGLEDVDIDKFVTDKDRVQALFGCLMDQTPCGKLQALRDTLPRMVETNCADCTPKLKEVYENTNKQLLQKYPEQFKLLVDKYSSKSD